MKKETPFEIDNVPILTVTFRRKDNFKSYMYKKQEKLLVKSYLCQ